jgi:hypothetical protein
MKKIMLVALLLTRFAWGQKSALYSDYVLKPSIFELMPESLKAHKGDFAARLETIMPIEMHEGYYFGYGCKAHECGSNEAAWVINKATGESAAIIMRYVPAIPGGIEAHENFELYGVTLDELPKPLADWALQNGMTLGNTVEVPSVMSLTIK